MFKKAVHITLIILLLSSTAGMAVSKLYCRETLVSVSIFSEADTCCDDMSCCHNENEFFQLKENFSIPVPSMLPVLAEIDILDQDLLNIDFLFSSDNINTSFLFNDSPHTLTVQEVLSLGQVYLL